jgi:Fur family transcriptional regulator, ferric uptake regulator
MKSIRNKEEILTGRRFTPQRRILMDIFCESGGNIDARELFRRAVVRDASISLATVYRTLNLLKEVGCIDEIRVGDRRCWHEVQEGKGTACMICRGCGKVIPFESAHLENLMKEMHQKQGFVADNRQLCIQGCCAECLKKQKSTVGK